MRTNIVLNDEIVSEAFKYTNVKSKKELVELALIEFVNNHKRKNIGDLKGKIHFRDDYDYKQMRTGK